MSFKKIILFKILITNLIFISIIIIRLFKKLKVLICTIGKEENKYIKEFIDYYRKLKIKKIIIYDNNNIDGENFQNNSKKYLKKLYFLEALIYWFTQF